MLSILAGDGGIRVAASRDQVLSRQRQRRAGAVALQASLLAARARPPAGHDGQVAKLRGGAECSAVDFPIHHHGTTDAGTQGEQNPRPCVLCGTQVVLPQRRRVGVVLQLHRQPQLRAQPLGNFRIPPRQVRGEAHRIALGINEPRHSQTHRSDTLIAALQAAYCMHQRGLQCVHVRGRGQLLDVQDLPVRVHYGSAQVRATDVHAHG